MNSVQSGDSKPEPDGDTLDLEVAQEEQTWDEERIEKALKTLKEMHIQVRWYRSKPNHLLILPYEGERATNHNTATYCASI